ncbi:hypothetical protein AIG44_24690 [Salmonella enterica subsp. enterica serovar Bredeney]|nr:hypothetical protein [Salmonella enterica subsp. enterica serovar Bredeney]
MFPVPVLLPGNKKTKTRQLWMYIRDDRNVGSALAVWFAYSPGRNPSADTSVRVQGGLQADTYAGSNELYREGHTKEAACWAHVRRKIHNVYVRTPSVVVK